MVDAVIAGAGIAGVATAWRLAERLGTTDAVLVDPRPPLSVTSNRPEANYRDWWPQRPMTELADRSLALVAKLLADGASIPMDRRGYLYITRDEARADTLEQLLTARAAAGFPGGGAEALDAAALRSAWPHLAPDIVAGLRVRRAGGIDTVALGRAMLDRARRRGVTVIQGTVLGVDAEAGGVRSVEIQTVDGRRTLETRRFVNAAGPFARPLLDLVGVELPIEMVLRQKVVVVDRGRVVPRGAPFTITLDPQRLDAGAPGALPGGIHVKPDDSAGPSALKLGWAWDQRPTPPVIDPECPPEFASMVLRGIASWIPGLAGTNPEDITAHEGGFYARVPDGQPVIGRAGPEGSFIVGGLAGFGAMMAASVGELAAAWIAGDDPTRQMLAFAPHRFADADYLAGIATGKVATGEL